jgi:hypothetical protein
VAVGTVVDIGFVAGVAETVGVAADADTGAFEVTAGTGETTRGLSAADSQPISTASMIRQTTKKMAFLIISSCEKVYTRCQYAMQFDFMPVSLENQ